MRRLVAVLVVLAAACGGGDGDDAGPSASGTGSGCPVDPDRVAELLGYDVVVDEDTAAASSCRFDPADADLHPGARVIVTVRRLATDGFDAALAAVEAESGPTQHLSAGDINGADRGWIARLGRVVQVGAARGRRLVQVTVADTALDADAAQAIAVDLAEAAVA